MNLGHVNNHISPDCRWTDTCGNQRTGAEPDERRRIRYALQSASSDKEFYFYKNLLKDLDLRHCGF